MPIPASTLAQDKRFSQKATFVPSEKRKLLANAGRCSHFTAMSDEAAQPETKRRGRPPKPLPKVLEQAKEARDHDYERAAEMLRDKGRLSVKGTRERIDQALAFCKLHPIIEIAKLAQDPLVSPELRLKALTVLANKTTPDLKSVDLQAEVKSDIRIVVKNFAGAVDAVTLARPINAIETPQALPA